MSPLVKRVREFLERPGANDIPLVGEVFSTYVAFDGNVPDEEWHDLVRMIGDELRRLADEGTGEQQEVVRECADICEAIVLEAEAS